MKPFPMRRLRDVYREMGFGKLLLYGADRLLRKLCSRCNLHLYRFVAQPLTEQPRLSPRRGKAFSFCVLDAPDPLLCDLDRPAEAIAMRFAQGAECIAAVKNQHLAGCIWFIRSHFAEDEVRAEFWLPTEHRCVWDFDVFVAESERAGVLFPKLWDFFDAYLKTEGVEWTLSRIDAFNQRSLASHRRLGAVDCGWAFFLRLKAFEVMCSDLPPYVHAGFRRRPVFRLRLPATRYEI